MSFQFDFFNWDVLKSDEDKQKPTKFVGLLAKFVGLTSPNNVFITIEQPKLIRNIRV